MQTSLNIKGYWLGAKFIYLSQQNSTKEMRLFNIQILSCVCVIQTKGQQLFINLFSITSWLRKIQFLTQRMYSALGDNLIQQKFGSSNWLEDLVPNMCSLILENVISTWSSRHALNRNLPGERLEQNIYQNLDMILLLLYKTGGIHPFAIVTCQVFIFLFF